MNSQSSSCLCLRIAEVKVKGVRHHVKAPLSLSPTLSTQHFPRKLFSSLASASSPRYSLSAPLISVLPFLAAGSLSSSQTLGFVLFPAVVIPQAALTGQPVHVCFSPCLLCVPVFGDSHVSSLLHSCPSLPFCICSSHVSATGSPCCASLHHPQAQDLDRNTPNLPRQNEPTRELGPT